MGHVGFQGDNKPKTIAKTGGEMERGAQQPDHRNPYRETARLHAGVEGIALYDGVETVPLGLDGLFYQRWSLQNVMQAGQRFALFKQTQHRAATEIFRIGKFENGIRRRVTLKQLEDVSLKLGRVAVKGMVQKHYAHGRLLGVE
jgi:hypothetical protein